MSLRARAIDVTIGGHAVLRGVDCLAPTGAVTGIVGPNGSGKTTLVRALLGMVPLRGGAVTLDGTDVRTRSRRALAREVAYVGQLLEPPLDATVAQSVGLAALAAGVGGRHFDVRIAEALAQVGLAATATRPMAELSGGERQRVAIARALAQRAHTAVLDEPTNHLDVRSRLDIANLLPHIASTVVVVLHDLDLAARVCDHVVLLDAGRVFAAGAPTEVLTAEHLDRLYRVRTTAHGTPPVFRFDLPSPTAVPTGVSHDHHRPFTQPRSPRPTLESPAAQLHSAS